MPLDSTVVGTFCVHWVGCSSYMLEYADHLPSCACLPSKALFPFFTRRNT